MANNQVGIGQVGLLDREKRRGDESRHQGYVKGDREETGHTGGEVKDMSHVGVCRSLEMG